MSPEPRVRQSEVGDTSVAKESVRDGSSKSASSKPVVIQPGSAYIGRFELVELLGEGAFGQVFRARDPQLDRNVAIKTPREGVIATEADRERFLREARALATVQHPNICPVYEVGESDGKLYTVMAYIAGKSLAEALKERKTPMSAQQAVLIIRKLALALEAAHAKSVVHRDLKPANIMFDRERKDVVVMDFGLARREAKNEAEITQSGMILGTPAYMAPEQARGDAKAVGPPSDVYALGVILYELLAGRRPFVGSAGEVIGQVLHLEPEPPSSWRTGIDPRLQAICMKAIAKNLTERYHSMRELAAALADWLRTPTASATTATPTEGAATEGALGLQQMFSGLSSERKTATAIIPSTLRRIRLPRWPWLVGATIAVVAIVMGIIFSTRGRKGPGAGNTEIRTPSEIAKSPSSENDIVRESIPDGFKSLFNGSDLSGWVVLKTKDAAQTQHIAGEGGWEAQNGAMVCTSTDAGWLRSSSQYSNFELALDFNLPPLCNSGLYIRCPDQGHLSNTGMEIQLIDDDGYAPIRDDNRTGAIVRAVGHNQKALRPAGQWNSLRVRSEGDSIAITLNGVRVVDAELSKIPALANRPRAGYIGFSNWNGQAKGAAFRNISIREIASPTATVDGFVSLFNGQNLTGWKRHAEEVTKWDVVDGCITASGPPGHLFSVRDDYRDFIYRIEAKINDGGNSGQYFRTKFAKWPPGYEAQINVGHSDPNRTGSLYPCCIDSKLSADVRDKLIVRTAPHKANEWFTQEVTAIANHITIKVNGQMTVDFVDESNAHSQGHFAIQHHNPNSKVMVRKVEVKELPRPAAAPPAPPATVEGFVSAFNGKDLTGIDVHRGNPKQWTVVDGVLSGDATAGLTTVKLGSHRLPILRFEYRLSSQCTAAISLALGNRHTLELDLTAPDAEPAGNGAAAPPTGNLTWMQEGQRGNRAPEKPASLRPGDQWNTVEIDYALGKIAVRINGEVVQNISQTEIPLFKASWDKGELRQVGIFFRVVRGQFEFREPKVKRR